MEIVCPPKYYRAADHTCKLCHEIRIGGEVLLEYAPVCETMGATLETLVLANKTWRATNSSSNIFLCKRSKGCRGGRGNLTYPYSTTRELSSFGYTDGYCAFGYMGPLCSACQPQFFMTSAKVCEECGLTGIKIAIAASVGVAVLLALLVCYLYRARLRGCLRATNFLRRMITMSRLKIVLSTYQIIASVMWGVPDVTWPEPFNSFGTMLELLNFLVIGTACINEGYNFYVQIFLVTLTPIILSSIILLTARVRMWLLRGRPKDDEAKCDQIMRQHWWTFILLSYVVMPSTSVSIIRVFLCHEGFGEAQNEAYLRADYALHCYTVGDDGSRHFTTEHSAMRVYAWLMILIYPIGINIMYTTLLVRNRETINPHKQTLAKALIIRQSNSKVQSLSFIYKYYKPSCYLFEIVDSLRRLLLGGLFVFFSEANDALNCWWAFLIAFVFYQILRETQPFVEPSNNTLAVVAQLVIMLLFLAGFILSVQPFDYDPNMWGWILFLTGIAVVTLALWFQYAPTIPKRRHRIRHLAGAATSWPPQILAANA